MQIDTWLTDTSYPDRCPLCSQPLTSRSNTCPSCGFTAHEPAHQSPSSAGSSVSRQSNPITPIPARASAQRIQSRPGAVPRRGRTGVSLASSPSAALPGPKTEGWRHKSANYEAASSLSSLSLIISETPTVPPRASRLTEHQERIDEIDTIPQSAGAISRSEDHVLSVPSEGSETPLASGSLSLRFDDLEVPALAVMLSETTPPLSSSYIDEIDTVPEVDQTSAGALVPLQSMAREVAVDAASWTAGPGSTSSLAARFIVAHSSRRQSRTRVFNPLDRTRWWLLRPGHIEFLFWTVGSLLLFGITFLILLATVLSVMIPGLPTRGNFPTSTVKAAVVTPAGTLAASNSIHLTLSGNTSLPPGAEMHLQGEGFHPQSKIVFLLDGHLALLDQHGQAASIQTDASGRFVVNLWLGQGSDWSAGSHQILARETASGHQVTIAITITVASTAPVTGNPGVQNTPPVNPTSTPVPATPTPVPATPTATPSATPTTTSSPSPTPPAKAPGTPALPVSTSTSAGSSALGNSLNNEGGNTLFVPLAHLNPLIWLVGICYFISMLLLGMAGLLRHRRF